MNGAVFGLIGVVLGSLIRGLRIGGRKEKILAKTLDIWLSESFAYLINILTIAPKSSTTMVIVSEKEVKTAYFSRKWRCLLLLTIQRK